MEGCSYFENSGIFEDVDNRFILQGGRLKAATVNIVLIQFTPSQSLLDFKYYRATRLLSLSVYHNCKTRVMWTNYELWQAQAPVEHL